MQNWWRCINASGIEVIKVLLNSLDKYIPDCRASVNLNGNSKSIQGTGSDELHRTACAFFRTSG